MSLYNQQQYNEMLLRSVERFPDWEKLVGKKFVISGGSGMILSYMIDVILTYNHMANGKIRIISIGRNEKTFAERFAHWYRMDSLLSFVNGDVSCPLNKERNLGEADFVIHGASTTHPKDYMQYPVETIMTNVMGTKNMLELACSKKKSRFLLMSSVEIYGDDCGYINCNTLRAGYPEGKRVSEALCQAYRTERKVEAVILRIPRSYGPTLRKTDSKALSQFLKNCLKGEDIVLKSKGDQLFSYAYVADVVQGILLTLTRGIDGEAYNLSNPTSDIRLRDLAVLMANYSGTKVVFDLPDEQEKKGFSASSIALINADKLRGIGWKPMYSIEAGTQETISILKEIW